jgi:hypothetical protein
MPDYTDYVSDIVHEPTQTDGPGFDLTVAAVYDVVEPGRVDFGGGELESAAITPHKSHKRDPDDDYEWWQLREGQYLIEYNESLAAGATVTLQPRTAIVERGGSHPTLQVDELPRIPLSVGGAGLLVKENARVSTIVDVDE